MFRLIRFTFRTILSIKLVAVGLAAGLATVFALQQRALYRSWGVVEGGAGRDTVGDDIVSAPDGVETRSIDIEATPDEVWPWIVQMGYGRGGWYAYPVLDRPWSPSGGAMGRSADSILEGYQDLAEGDLVPTHPGGGFVARVVDPGRALVLYLDDELMREQLASLAAASAEDTSGAVAEMDVVGAGMDMPPFAVSWAFELADAPGGRTRLVERLRYRIEKLTPEQRRAMPMVSYGAFVLLRSQLLGIRQRAEATVAKAA